MKTTFLFSALSFSIALPAQWQTYTVANSGLTDNSCWYVNTDANNEVWVSTTNNGLNKFDGSNWNGWNQSNSSIPFNNTSVSFFDGNNLWLGTDGGGVGKYNGVVWQTYNTSNSAIGDNTVYDIEKDAAGNLWMGSRWAGLIKYNGTSFVNYSIQSQLQATFDRVHNIVIDASGMIWMGLAGGGLGRYNPVSGGMTQWGTWNSAIADNDVYSLCIAPNGKIWCGTFGGISVFDPVTNNFTAIYTIANSALPSNYVRAIVFDDAGDCWIGTGWGGVARLSNNSFTIWNDNNSNLPSDSVWSVHYSNNRIWVATITEGIATMLLNPKSVEENQQMLSLSFLAFPNPASDQVTVDFVLEHNSKMQMQIFNSAGQLVKAEMWELLPGNIRKQIFTGDLASGIYTLRLADDNYSGTRQIIIQ
jgi:ligand-binding sensor domain-containing protein